MDTRATFPGGGEGTGLDGLRAYLRERRQDEFVDNLCRKLLAYALGADAAAVGRRDHRRHAEAAGGRRLSIRQPGREHCHQPAVPEQASRQPTRRRNQDHERIEQRQDRPSRSAPGIPADVPPRRGRDDGPAVARVGPGLGSPPVAGGLPAAVPEAVRRPVHGLRRQPHHWWAKGAGAEWSSASAWSRWPRCKAKINVINGLFNKHATGVGIHPGQTGNILSGAALQKGAELKGGISIDQVLASHLGEETVQPSMVLGCEQPITGYHETNFSMAYSSHISWQSATSPVPMEVYPSLAFDSLFDNRGSQRNQSILDRVREEAAGLSRQVSSGDRAKLDEYLTSVREVESRVAPMRPAKQKADDRASDRGRPVPRCSGPTTACPRTSASTCG